MKNKWIISLYALLLCLVLLSLTFGAVTYSWWNFFEWSSSYRQEFLTIRLSRVISAGMIGSTLSISGLILRKYTQNDLADPGLLGIISSSQLGLLLVVLLLPKVSYIWRFIGAFAGACIMMWLLFGVMKQFCATTFILMGVTISAFCMGIVTILASIFQKNTILADWNAGGLQSVTGQQCFFIAFWSAIALIICLIYQRELELYMVSPQNAQNIGISPKKIQWIVGTILCFFVGSSVTVAGNLAFFGLMASILAEALAHHSFKKSFYLSFPIGACLMLLADLISRLWNAPQETSLSAVVAVLCAPVFFLYVKKKGVRL